MKSAQKRNVSSKLQETVRLTVEFEAYPPPQVRWSKDGAAIREDKTSVTRPEGEIR